MSGGGTAAIQSGDPAGAPAPAGQASLVLERRRRTPLRPEGAQFRPQLVRDGLEVADALGEVGEGLLDTPRIDRFRVERRIVGPRQLAHLKQYAAILRRADRLCHAREGVR